MIIKSLTRKSNYFRQPVNYILQKGDLNEQEWILLYNIDCSPTDKNSIIEAFKKNDTFRKKRKNGVAMYHEIISFSTEDRDIILDNPYIMEDLAREYLQLRSPHGLGMAYPHYDTQHPHVHILLSANQKESSDSIRISKNKFRKIKNEMERVMIEQYPELDKSVVPKHLTSAKDQDISLSI